AVRVPAGGQNVANLVTWQALDIGLEGFEVPFDTAPKLINVGLVTRGRLVIHKLHCQVNNVVQVILVVFDQGVPQFAHRKPPKKSKKIRLILLTASDGEDRAGTASPSGYC